MILRDEEVSTSGLWGAVLRAVATSLGVHNHVFDTLPIKQTKKNPIKPSLMALSKSDIEWYDKHCMFMTEIPVYDV